MFYVIYNSK